MSKYFCKMPFMAVEISNDGSITPCCSFIDRNITESDGTSLNVNNMSLEKAVSGDFFTNIRQRMLEGKPVAGCNKCYEIDSYGGRSHRQRFNDEFSDIDVLDKTQFDFKSLDIKLSNVCNQMCVICNPYASSMIAAERKEINPASLVNFKHENFNWYRNDAVWESIKNSLSNVQHLDFYGGEPWLIKKHWDLLEYIISSGFAKNIRLNYATNGSLFNEKWFTEYFSKFKDVSILVSADGIRETFEYTRYPAKWNTFEKNLDSIKYITDNTDIVSWLGISYTVSAYSVFNIIESLDYYTEKSIPVWFNLVNENYHDVSVLPDQIKKTLHQSMKEKWNKNFNLVDNMDHSFITDRLLIENDTNLTKMFLEKTKTLDEKRKNCILDIIPELQEFY